MGMRPARQDLRILTMADALCKSRALADRNRDRRGDSDRSVGRVFLGMPGLLRIRFGGFVGVVRRIKSIRMQGDEQPHQDHGKKNTDDH